MPNDTRPKEAEDLLAERLQPILEAVAARIHYAEARRTNYSVLAGVFVAAGIAILTFSFGAIDTLVIRYGAAFAAAAMILLGLAIVWVFGRQTNRYPFTEATQTWKWFYRDALPRSTAFQIPWQSYVRWGKEKARVQTEYTNQLPGFEERMRDLSDTNASVEQDLQQLYTLHVNELFKNLFLNHLRQLLNVGIIGIVLATMVGAAYGMWEDSRFRRTRIVGGTGGLLQETFRWRQMAAPLASSALVAVEANVKNQSSQSMHLDSIVAVDAAGWPLPAKISYPYDPPGYLGPGQEQTLIAHLEMQREVATAIRGFAVQTK
jgi:hypothetical protein